LLLVSSPFPPVASPANILDWVEAEFAFLSMLWPAAGFAAAAASTSRAVPYPTLSTNVVPASLYNKTVLFAAILVLVE